MESMWDGSRCRVVVPGAQVGEPTEGTKSICDINTYILYSGKLSSDQNPGYLLYRGDYATQVYGDYNKPI